MRREWREGGRGLAFSGEKENAWKQQYAFHIKPAG